MRWLTHQPWKIKAYWAVMLVSGASVLWIPPAWTDGVKNFTQLLVPIQSPAYSGARSTAMRLAEWSASVQSGASSPADERIALQNQVAALCDQLEQVRTENSRLRGLRELYVPPAVRIVPARVVARDVSSWRDSLLLSRGRRSGVDRSDPVTSRLFVNRGGFEGVGLQHRVLAGEFLIGEVDQAGPLMARVRLYSDLGVRTEVRIGRNVDGRFKTVDYPCTLLGRGHGEMVIENVPLRFIARDGAADVGAQAIRTGDLVVSVAAPPNLPTAMVIGRVASFEDDPRKRLVAAVHVEPGVPADQIGDVFIITD